MVNDPKLILPQDVPYQNAWHLLSYTEAFAGALLWSWGALFLHLRSHLRIWQGATIAGIFLLAWTTFSLVSGH